ncbi:hypothetical protein BYT27DRAFT_7199248, partial [Phlegmacium glaucopus]
TEKTGSHELKALTEWSWNVIFARDYTSLAGVDSMVHEMTREVSTWCSPSFMLIPSMPGSDYWQSERYLRE